MARVDLNVDIGEGFPNDGALLSFATSANICCGVHAGSWDLTARTVELCLSKAIRIGAHPGYPDREFMGRRDPVPEEQAAFGESILQQVTRFAAEFPCAYIKPHGAWYNAIVAGDAFAHKVLERVRNASDLPMMLLRGFELSHPISVIREAFADRAYLPNGQLMPRSQPGAVLHDPRDIKNQVLQLAPTVDSICLHGDTPNALEFAELVYKTLVDAGYEVGV
jgi:UPF0271 protein